MVLMVVPSQKVHLGVRLELLSLQRSGSGFEAVVRNGGNTSSVNARIEVLAELPSGFERVASGTTSIGVLEELRIQLARTADFPDARHYGVTFDVPRDPFSSRRLAEIAGWQ